MTIQVQAVETAIKKNDAGWQAQKNFLTTLSREERARYLGYVPGPGEPSLEQAEQAAKASLAAAKAPGLRIISLGAPVFDLLGRIQVGSGVSQAKCRVGIHKLTL